LFEHSPGQFVRDLEIENSGHNTTGLNEIKKSPQLRSNPCVGREVAFDVMPEIEHIAFWIRHKKAFLSRPTK
jgi:hypothetical protein